METVTHGTGRVAWVVSQSAPIV